MFFHQRGTSNGNQLKFSTIQSKLVVNNTRFFDFPMLGIRDHLSNHFSTQKATPSLRTGQAQTIELSSFDQKHIRNFAVIAHIDHGKTTLSNQFLILTKTKKASEQSALDNLQVEQERGITVKAHTSSMFYEHGGENYLLNLIE